jgi:multiple sugar transport system permease protein/raffinose/stachyose/melibiose transport system permease protein
MIRRKNNFNLLYYVILVAGSLFVLIPIIYMLSTSLKSIEEILTSPRATLFPRHFTTDAYRNIWTEYPFLAYFRNSMVVTLSSTILAVIFSAMAGYGFSRFNFRSKNSLMLFILATQMFPSVMLFVPYFKLLTIYGLSNTRIGLSLVYIGSVIPFCSWMMFGFFDNISRELDEAALIDGCGRIKTFVQIIAPLTLPGLISTVIYAFIQGWNEYMFAMLFTTSDSMKTLPVAIGQMAGFYSIMWNDLMAASIISSLPVLILFIVLQRYFISSLTTGAVKG